MKLAHEASETSAVTPLEFLLSVVEDKSQPVELRLRAAAVALPFLYAKPAPPSAKAAREAEALTAGRGTDWEQLLSPGPRSHT